MIPNLKNCMKSIGSGSQMCNLSEEFITVLFFLYGKIRSRSSNNFYFIGLYFKLLPASWRFDQFSLYEYRCTDVDILNLFKIIQILIEYYLYIFKISTIVYFD